MRDALQGTIPFDSHEHIANYNVVSVECCFLRSGGIRAGKDYKDRPFFSYADLKAEIPFDNNLAVMPVPGSVLAAAIKFSRAGSLVSPPQSSGGFCQIDDKMTFDEATQTLTHIGGEPIDLHKLYLTGLDQTTLSGMDNVKPIVDWVKENKIPMVILLTYFYLSFYLSI